MNTSNFRITGPFQNPGPLAIWLAISVPAHLFFLARQAGKTPKRLTFLSLIVVFVAILLTESRAAYFGITASCLYLYHRRILDQWHLMKRNLKFLSFFGFSLVIVYVMYVLYMFKANSVSGRLLIWKVSYKMFADNIFTGSGFDTFRRQYGIYLAKYVSTNKLGTAEIFRLERVNFCFNDIYQFLIEQGILLSILAGIIAIITLRNNFKKGGIYHYVNGGIILILSASLFSYPFEIPIIWLSLSILIGLSARPPGIKYDLLITNLRIYLFLLLILWGIEVKWMLDKIKANSLSDRAIELLSKRRVEDAITEFEKSHEISHDDFAKLLPYAKALNLVGQYAKSNVIVTQTKTLVYDTFQFLLEAENFEHLGMNDSAIESYQIAISLDPKLMYPKYCLAKFYIRSGAMLKAKAIAQEILNMEVKIESSAIQEMRADILRLVKLKKL